MTALADMPPLVTVSDYLTAAYGIQNGLIDGTLDALARQMAAAGFDKAELQAERARFVGVAQRCFVSGSNASFLDLVIPLLG